MPQFRAEIGDERAKRLGGLTPPIVVAQRAEPTVPVVVSRNTGKPADTLPTGRAQVLAVVVAQRKVGKHVEDVSSAQSTAVDVE